METQLIDKINALNSLNKYEKQLLLKISNNIEDEAPYFQAILNKFIELIEIYFKDNHLFDKLMINWFNLFANEIDTFEMEDYVNIITNDYDFKNYLVKDKMISYPKLSNNLEYLSLWDLDDIPNKLVDFNNKEISKYVFYYNEEHLYYVSRQFVLYTLFGYLDHYVYYYTMVVDDYIEDENVIANLNTVNEQKVLELDELIKNKI